MDGTGPGERAAARPTPGARRALAARRAPAPAPGLPLTLSTSDGQVLAARHVPPTTGLAEVAVVVAHGFGGGLHRPALHRILTRLSTTVGVVSFDFRGHGRSTGFSTLGDREVLDLDAAVAAARGLGYRQVATVGFSMGGAVAIRHAGLDHPHPPDAVVTVSTGSRWYQRDTRPMRRVHWLVEQPLGRRVARLALGVRVSPTGWAEIPPAPIEVVGRIAPRPLVVVHGDRDGYFGVRHAYDLAGAAGDPVELWLVPGFGHGEVAAPAELIDRVAHWVAGLPARAGR